MARQPFGGKRDKFLTNNLIINDKESAQLSTKLVSLDIQQRKEMARWEREKNKLSLPSIKTAKCERISLTPPPSPTTSPLQSPVLRRRGSENLATLATTRSEMSESKTRSSRGDSQFSFGSDGLRRSKSSQNLRLSMSPEPARGVGSARFQANVAKIECPNGNNQCSLGSDINGLRRSKSSQNLRLSISPQPPRGVGSASPRVLPRLSTMGQVRLHRDGKTSPPTDTGRRFSAGLIPSIQVDDSSEILDEKVKKFNESLVKFTKEASQGKNIASPSEDDLPPTEELLTPQRPLAHRWKSLPSILQATFKDENSAGEMTFCEDMTRCRYLRIPDKPALSIEEIFDKDPKQTAK